MGDQVSSVAVLVVLLTLSDDLPLILSIRDHISLWSENMSILWTEQLVVSLILPLPLYNNNRIYLMIQDMAYGPFGGVAGRDFLAVQSMDGNYLPTTSLSL